MYYNKNKIIVIVLLIFQINKYPKLSVQAILFELPMFKNDLNSQYLIPRGVNQRKSKY